MTLSTGIALSPIWLRGEAWRRDDSRVEDHPSGSWFQEPGQRLQQRRLAAAVRPHHGGEFCIENREVQAAGDDAVAVAEPRPVGPQSVGGCHADLLPSRTRR